MKARNRAIQRRVIEQNSQYRHQSRVSEISGFRWGANEICTILACYAGQNGGHRHFGTNYRSHLPRVKQCKQNHLFFNGQAVR